MSDASPTPPQVAEVASPAPSEPPVHALRAGVGPRALGPLGTLIRMAFTSVPVVFLMLLSLMRVSDPRIVHPLGDPAPVPVLVYLAVFAGLGLLLRLSAPAVRWTWDAWGVTEWLGAGVRAAVPWRDARVVDYVTGAHHPQRQLTLTAPHATLALWWTVVAPRGTISLDARGLRSFASAARADAAHYELGPPARYRIPISLPVLAHVGAPIAAAIACALVLRTPAAPRSFVAVHAYLCAALLLLGTLVPLGEALALRRGARLERGMRVVLTDGADGVLRATDAAGARLAIDVSGLAHPDTALSTRRGPARVLLEARDRAADGAYRDGGVVRATALETVGYLSAEARLRRALALQAAARVAGAAILVALTLAATRAG